MGDQVRRPIHEGLGEKPSTAKPDLREVLKAEQGQRPATPKPQIGQPVGQAPAQAQKP